MTEQLEMGPIDYVIIEWPDRQPHGEALPHLLDLVDHGIVRILDAIFIRKSVDGTWESLELDDLDSAFAVLDGVQSGLLDDGDLEEAAKALKPGTSAAVLVWENHWAAPFATAVRRNGGQLVASGRVPGEALAAAAQQLVRA